MADVKPFKPSLAFLRKVRDRGVYRARRYSRNRGGYSVVVGGEKMIEAHAVAGLIREPYIADLGRPSYATLTPKGEALLEVDNG